MEKRAEMQDNTPLSKILEQFRNATTGEREKGVSFKELITCYLKNEVSQEFILPLRHPSGKQPKWKNAMTAST